MKMGFFDNITLVLVVLKLFNLIDIGWFSAIFPSLIPFISAFIAVLIMTITASFNKTSDKKE